jgi:hypothetical protein
MMVMVVWVIAAVQKSKDDDVDDSSTFGVPALFVWLRQSGRSAKTEGRAYLRAVSKLFRRRDQG